jgi:hypothetical protein
MKWLSHQFRLLVIFISPNMGILPVLVYKMSWVPYFLNRELVDEQSLNLAVSSSFMGVNNI